MRICERIAELRVALAGAARPMGFVPTMGALHEGHAACFRACLDECATSVASIFVNPLQFNEEGDLAHYPRPFEKDCAMLEELDVDIVFHPSAEEIYPRGFGTRVQPGTIASLYEGEHRPGHLAGVATVVLKLLNAVGCDRAYFGRKDAQQLALVRAMVRDLDLPVEIVPVETARDADGLALSSRNTLLGDDERRQALGLSRGLCRARDAWQEGERDFERLAARAREPGLDYDYVACVDPRTFQPPAPGGPALVVVAARVGPVRLLDNILLRP